MKNIYALWLLRRRSSQTFPGSASQSFTAAAWVQLENELTYSTAFSQDGANVSGFYLQYLSPTDSGLGSAAGKFAFALLSSDSTGAAPARAVSPFAPVANTWYHLAGVYDSNNQVIKLYVNGSLVATQSVPTAWSATGPAAIGRGKFGQPSDFWPGRITDARLYSPSLLLPESFELTVRPTRFLVRLLFRV